MENITFSSNTLQKAVILPTEVGIYKGTIGTNVIYIIVEDSCIEDIRIKWLSRDGIYRHGTFNKYTSEKWNTKENGSIEIFNDSLSTATAKSSVISKDNTRTFTLRKINVPTEIYKIYMDLSASPKVYINVGDIINDKWIEVAVKWTPNLDAKKNFHQITLEVELPDDYIQKL